MVDLQGNFILLTLVMWILGCVSSSVAMLVGSVESRMRANDYPNVSGVIRSVLSNVKQASEAAPLLFVPQILFAGFYIRIELIPGTAFLDVANDSFN